MAEKESKSAKYILMFHKYLIKKRILKLYYNQKEINRQFHISLTRS